jgi:hypothetical protein
MTDTLHSLEGDANLLWELVIMVVLGNLASSGNPAARLPIRRVFSTGVIVIKSESREYLFGV